MLPTLSVVAGVGLLAGIAASTKRDATLPAMPAEQVRSVQATAESIDAKRLEMKQLAEKEIPANRKAIEEARAMGDLRENFEYKSARERHEYLNARLAALHRDLSRARPIELANQDLSEVRIGTSVELASAAGRSLRYTVLGPWESRPEAGVPSYESELGKALLGRKVTLPYRWIYCLLIPFGAVIRPEVVWSWGDLMNALQVFPNLVGLIGLSGIAAAYARRRT